MASDPKNNRILEEIKCGEKPSDELKDYLRKLSAARSGRSSPSISPIRVGPGLLRHRWKKLQPSGGGPFSPCADWNSLAMAAPYIKGYTLGSNLQLGNQVGVANFPGVNPPIPLHTKSSLVDATTGEFLYVQGSATRTSPKVEILRGVRIYFHRK
jgi:hypothetical protein